MDGSAQEHNDSDSGESWILLDRSENITPIIDDDIQKLQQKFSDNDRNITEGNDRDDDTDGISIISDSEPESTPCELSHERCLLADDSSIKPQYISVNPLPPDNNNHHELIQPEDDLLGDNNGKHKTYVHRRNKRLSTVLNIIMLGSVITAAGVAIGHMWGAKNDCSMHTTPSVNKILSNLYKLQEENAYLRSKLKELTLLTNNQMQRRPGLDNLPVKQPKCRKLYEESLNRNAEKLKCIDNKGKNLGSVPDPHLEQPQIENEFLNNINKLKDVYQQNKSWLDYEILKRIKSEKENMKKFKNSLKTVNLSPVDEEKYNIKEKSVEKANLELTNLPNSKITQQKVSYADSLKSDQHIKNVQKRGTNANDYKEPNRKTKKSHSPLPETVPSEEDFQKDTRYIELKKIQEQKKRDRQKIPRKHKRNNKYEQWEMKGGYLKDYDEISVNSQENEHVQKKPQQIVFNRDYEKENYLKLFSGTEEPYQFKIIETHVHKTKFENTPSSSNKLDKNTKANNANWYENRAAFRTEARRRLEHELFGETDPDSGEWYFRRMHRREQCRAKGENSTYRKQSKRNMNFKMKH